MGTQLTCPHCGEMNVVADDSAGQTGQCIHCGKELGTPTAESCNLRSPFRRAAKFLLVLAGIVLVVGLLSPLYCSAPEASRRLACSNNLKNIALAMHNYEQAYRCFPPAYVPDKHGKPMHSWRVLLLPFLEKQALYSQYRFNEPWNSPNNRKVTDRATALYQCPSQFNMKAPTTN